MDDNNAIENLGNIQYEHLILKKIEDESIFDNFKQIHFGFFE